MNNIANKKKSLLLIVILLLLAISADAYGFSMRETNIRNQRPKFLKQYNGGPISPLSDKDIQEAIEFGKENKNSQSVINYAFMYEKGGVYVHVGTNYYLIANYSAKQHRNYDPIDMEYVQFLAALPVFRVSVNKTIGVTSDYNAIVSPSKFVLLQDEIKIKEADENPLYEGKSPYPPFNWTEAMNDTMNDMLAQSLEMANKYTEDIREKMNLPSGSIPTPVFATAKPSNLFKYSEIDKSAGCEIVIVSADEKEKRVKIDLSKIK